MGINRYGVEGGKGAGGQHLPFARAVETAGWLYVSGQVPMANGELIEGDILAQSRPAIINLIAILNEAGYGRNMWSVAAFGLKIRATFRPSMRFSRNTSASIFRPVPASYPAWLDCKVEIDCVANKSPPA